MSLVNPLECLNTSLNSSRIQAYVTLYRRVGLAQLVRFLAVELTHPSLNPKFDMGVIFITNYFFSGRRRPHHQ
jgi:hypothetical protein